MTTCRWVGKYRHSQSYSHIPISAGIALVAVLYTTHTIPARMPFAYLLDFIHYGHAHGSKRNTTRYRAQTHTHSHNFNMPNADERNARARARAHANTIYNDKTERSPHPLCAVICVQRLLYAHMRAFIMGLARSHRVCVCVYVRLFTRLRAMP